MTVRKGSGFGVQRESYHLNPEPRTLTLNLMNRSPAGNVIIGNTRLAWKWLGLGKMSRFRPREQVADVEALPYRRYTIDIAPMAAVGPTFRPAA